MSDFNAWYTSSSLIEAVKRKIAVPISQGFLSEQDILDFATEELLISQVPDIIAVHEEYFVYSLDVPIVQGVNKYKIPDRAIGMKLRDLWFRDTSGNLREMARIAPDDKAFYQNSGAGNNSTFQKYYLKSNYIHLTDNDSNTPGTLVMDYFLRPNRLVPDSRACYISSFTKEITVDNANLVAGDTVTIGSNVYTAVAGAPSALEFQIGASSAATATNLAAAIVNDVIFSVANSNIVTFGYEVASTTVSVSNNSGTALQVNQGVKFTTPVPSNITSGSLIDFLQTKPGHMLLGMNKKIPANSVSGDTISFLPSDIPSDIEIGDYVATAGECIIPMIPTDLHTNLADKACVRILAAMGDQQGAAEMKDKLGENMMNQNTLISNRVEGSLPKVIARHSLLRVGKLGPIKRF